ncbi:hypothetical protein LPJ66_005528 [Kickxella alabastrina]|uniref:Uncharacterized protein n=1 Tax=Kickxella alabastrina TaxID=61397 RepID=A0ACC1IKE4_9FUNG|nr:hypothetical protein LPJ66_005528 [Kickxella alabastrina]
MKPNKSKNNDPQSRQALEIYRSWLNENSSSSSSSGSGSKSDSGSGSSESSTNGNNFDKIGSSSSGSSIGDLAETNKKEEQASPKPAPRPAPPLAAFPRPAKTRTHPLPQEKPKPPPAPVPKPSPSPSVSPWPKHIHKPNSSPSQQSPTSKSKSPTSNFLRKPRNFIHQIPHFRSSSKGNQTRLSNSLPRRPSLTTQRNISDDHSMDTLYSGSWIAQPKIPKAGSMDEKPSFHDVSLKEPSLAPSSQQAASVRKQSHSWEYNTRDSLTGWMIVFWAFLAMFISLSTLFSYPVYESYYEATNRNSLTEAINGNPLILADLHRPQGEFAASAWRFSHRATTYGVLIGTLLIGFALLGALPAGLLTDNLGARASCFFGTFLLTVALFAASFVDQLPILCLLQGCLGGLGVGLLFTPAYTIPMQWFDRYRAWSTACALCGAAIGTLALAATYHALLWNHGLATSLRVQALLTLILGALASWGLRPRVHVPRAPPLGLHARDARLPALMLLVLFASAARCIQLLCLPSFARTTTGGSDVDGTNVLYALSAASLAGVLLGALLCDKCPATWPMLGLSELITAVLTLCIWVPAKSLAPMFVYAVLAGISSGSLATALPVVCDRLFGQSRLPTILGFVLAAGCPAVLAITPAAIKFSTLLSDGKSTAWLTGISGIFSLLAAAAGFLLPFLQKRYNRTNY